MLPPKKDKPTHPKTNDCPLKLSSFGNGPVLGVYNNFQITLPVTNVTFWGNLKVEPFVTFPLYWLFTRHPYDGLL